MDSEYEGGIDCAGDQGVGGRDGSGRLGRSPRACRPCIRNGRRKADPATSVRAGATAGRARLRVSAKPGRRDRLWQAKREESGRRERASEAGSLPGRGQKPDGLGLDTPRAGASWLHVDHSSLGNWYKVRIYVCEFWTNRLAPETEWVMPCLGKPRLYASCDRRLMSAERISCVPAALIYPLALQLT